MQVTTSDNAQRLADLPRRKQKIFLESSFKIILLPWFFISDVNILLTINPRGHQINVEDRFIMNKNEYHP